MNETVTRQRPSIDLDDFELRLQTQRHHDDDPLAELARIVGEQPDPYDDVFAQPAAAAPVAFRPSIEPHRRQEPSLGAPPPRFSADFAAIEAGLRGANGAPPAPPTQVRHADLAQVQVAMNSAEPTDEVQASYGFAAEPQFSGPQDAGWDQPEAVSAKGRTRRPVYAMAASIAIAVVGIGVAFAYKGTGSSPREIKTIMAAAGPTKIQPPAEQTADQGDQDVNALGQQPAPTKLVSREEQPVDLSQAVHDNAARDASRGTNASSVSVPPSPAQAEGTASPDYSALGGGAAPDAAAGPSASPAYGDQGFGIGMPRPKRVKSVSVRPDGSIVDDRAPAPSAIAPDDTTQAKSNAPAAPSDGVKSSDRAGPVAAATPAAPPHKTSTRAPAHAVAAAQPADDSDATPDAAAPQPPKSLKKTKPVRVASAETAPQDTAADSADEAKPAGAGAFAVQLAAPGSESDARSATTRFIKKYSNALHGRRLGFRRAESNGHTVYRVRVSSLTKEDATSLCGKLKADGGTCFVAKD